MPDMPSDPQHRDAADLPTQAIGHASSVDIIANQPTKRLGIAPPPDPLPIRDGEGPGVGQKAKGSRRQYEATDRDAARGAGA